MLRNIIRTISSPCRPATVAGLLVASLAMPPADLSASAPKAPKASLGATVNEVDLATLQARLASGRTTAEAITRAYLARIAAMDHPTSHKGPALHAIIALTPDALSEARAADARRRAGHPLGPLDGIPVLVKDNIETLDPIPTTAGSLALAANVTHRDAPVVARLRARGMVILGKTNLSEWANIRSTTALSGWSAMGGQARNPYALDRSPCGSSSGSAVAVAASFAPLALGTETNGSLVCPASLNGIVALKPTVGLVSRTHIVPISHTQDTAGPMARSVRGVALLLTAMAGTDPADPATREADAHARDYTEGLSRANLKGLHLAVLMPPAHSPLAAPFDAALAVLRQQGALLTLVQRPAQHGLSQAESTVLHSELKADLNAYLATTPPTVKSRSLADLIAFNDAHRAQEMPLFGQDYFLAAQATPGLDDPAYRAARAQMIRQAGAEGIEAMLTAANATILVEPTSPPAWLIDPVYGDYADGPFASGLPAMAGYPHLTVPMGEVMGLPVGLSFIGRPYTEAALLGAGYAYEQASHARQAPTYRPHIGP